jgi:hypothetical protein
MTAAEDPREAALLEAYEAKLQGTAHEKAIKRAAQGMLRARINALVGQGQTREEAVRALYEEACTANATMKPRPFFLFFDQEMLMELSGLYGLRKESVGKAFLAEAQRQNMIVSEIGSEELTDLKLHLDRLFEDGKTKSRETSAELKEAAKYTAKIALLGPLGSTLQRAPEFADVIGGLSIGSCTIVLIRLMVGALHKTSIIGAFISPKTGQSRERIAQYFKDMVSKVSALRSPKRIGNVPKALE